MTFDKNKVYTALNADEVKVGSKGYFADKLEVLRTFVSENEVPRTLVEVLGEEYERRFDEGGNPWNLFYLVEEPEGETNITFRLTKQEKIDYKSFFAQKNISLSFGIKLAIEHLINDVNAGKVIIKKTGYFEQQQE